MAKTTTTKAKARSTPTRKRAAKSVERPTATTAVAKRTTDERTTDLSEQWLELARVGEQTTIETLREFVETVEKAVPVRYVGLAKQREIAASALEMAQAIMRAQYDALRSLVRSAVLVNVTVDTNIDADVDVKVPTNVDVASHANVDVKVPTNVDAASRKSAT